MSSVHVVDADAERLLRHFCLEAECEEVKKWLQKEGLSRPDEFEERIALASQLKDRGNDRFQAAEFQPAMMYALGALHCLDFSQARATSHSDVQKREVQQVVARVLSNLSAIFLKRGDNYNSVRAADLGLEYVQRLPSSSDMEQLRAKLLFRRGVARGQTKDFAEARADLLEAAKLQPTNLEIRKALENSKVGLQRQRGAPDDQWRGLLTEAPEVARRWAQAKRYWQTARAVGKEVWSLMWRPGNVKAGAMLLAGPLLTFILSTLVARWAQNRGATI